jgi:hypothetical protein
MRTHLANAAYDVLDYDSYPIGLVWRRCVSGIAIPYEAQEGSQS